MDDIPPPWIALPGLAADDPANQGLAEAYIVLRWLPFWQVLTSDGKTRYLDRWSASPEWREAIALRYDHRDFDIKADTREAEQWADAKRQRAASAGLSHPGLAGSRARAERCNPRSRCSASAAHATTGEPPMTLGRIALLVGASLALLGVDTLIGVSGTLYEGNAAGFLVIGFIVAVAVAIAVGHAPLLFLLHNAALGYFLVRNVRMGVLDGLAEFIGIVVAINLLLLMITLARGVRSTAVSAEDRGDT